MEQNNLSSSTQVKTVIVRGRPSLTPWIVSCGLLAAVFGLSGYVAHTQKIAAPAVATAQVEHTPTTFDALSLLKLKTNTSKSPEVYTDSFGNFEFQYPAGFTVQQNTLTESAATKVYDYPGTEPKCATGDPCGTAFFELTIQPLYTAQSPENLASTTGRELQTAKIGNNTFQYLASTDPRLGGNRYYLPYPSKPNTWIYFELNLATKTDTADQILSSFKFLK